MTKRDMPEEEKSVQFPSINTMSHLQTAKSRKYANTSLGTHKAWVSRLVKNRFSGPHIEKNFHTLSKIPLKVGFTNRKKSHFQFAKMRKISSHEACFP